MPVFSEIFIPRAVGFFVTACCVIVAVSVLLHYLKCNPYYVVVNGCAGIIYSAITIWEALNTSAASRHYLFWLWVVTVPTMLLMPVVLYFTVLLYKMRFSWRDAAIMIPFGVGQWMFWGIWEDFGCYLIWGLKYFNPTEANWHEHWTTIGPVNFPTYYLMAPVGLTLIIVCLVFSRRDVAEGEQPQAKMKVKGGEKVFRRVGKVRKTWDILLLVVGIILIPVGILSLLVSLVSLFVVGGILFLVGNPRYWLFLFWTTGSIIAVILGAYLILRFWVQPKKKGEEGRITYWL